MSDASDIVYICNCPILPAGAVISLNSELAAKRATSMARLAFGASYESALRKKFRYYHGLLVPACIIPLDHCETTVFLVNKRLKECVHEALVESYFESVEEIAKEIETLVRVVKAPIDELFVAFCVELGPFFEPAGELIADFTKFSKISRTIKKVEKIISEKGK